MKTLKKFHFIVQEEAHKALLEKLDSRTSSKVLAGRSDERRSSAELETYCDPWIACDAWNCAPDCVCKSNLA